MTGGVRTNRRTRLAFGVYVTAIIVGLFAPLVVVVLFSLHSAPRLSFPFEGLSLSWYEEVFGDEEFRSALTRSLAVGAGTALISGALGLSAALALVRLGRRARGVVVAIALLPLAFPALLYGIGLAMFYREIGLGFSLWGTLAGHVVVTLPFAFLVIGAALDRFRFSLLEASRDLGATPLRAFWTVTLPNILPAVLGAMLIAMAVSVDEFPVAFFTAGPGNQTLPMLLYGRLNLGVTPTLNVVGTVLLALTMALALLSARMTTHTPDRE